MNSPTRAARLAQTVDTGITWSGMTDTRQAPSHPSGIFHEAVDEFGFGRSGFSACHMRSR
jgi:hypothetical protein